MSARTSEIPVNPKLRPLQWQPGCLRFLDQRRLPWLQSYVECRNVRDVADAIRDMVIRGAPAISFAAAWGMVLAVSEYGSDQQALERADQQLFEARPTAVNLRWALERLRPLWQGEQALSAEQLLTRLSDAAQQIEDEDLQASRRMGELGLSLLKTRPESAVLTHCNAGALATAGLGTALSVVRYGHADGHIQQVFADETRPWLQGARLTAYELLEDGIPTTLLADSAAPSLLASGKVGWVIVGADRITANGDVINKVGTYMLALAAKANNVGFMVVAPTSTLDHTTAKGRDVPIEQRHESEVLELADQRIAAPGAGAWNPAFDVTPAELVTVIVTEAGVIKNPGATGIAEFA